MLHVADEMGIEPAILPALGDHRTDDPEGESPMFGMLEGVVGIRIAYPGSLYFSDQL